MRVVLRLFFHMNPQPDELHEVILDDTKITKRAKSMDGVGRLFDSAKKVYAIGRASASPTREGADRHRGRHLLFLTTPSTESAGARGWGSCLLGDALARLELEPVLRRESG